MTDGVLERHLIAAMEELIERRNELDLEIQRVRSMLELANDSRSVGNWLAHSVSLSEEQQGSIAELIRQFVDRPRRTREIVEFVAGPGRTASSVRAALTKLAEQGELSRVEHGLYAPTYMVQDPGSMIVWTDTEEDDIRRRH